MPWRDLRLPGGSEGKVWIVWCCLHPRGRSRIRQTQFLQDEVREELVVRPKEEVRLDYYQEFQLKIPGAAKTRQPPVPSQREEGRGRGSVIL